MSESAFLILFLAVVAAMGIVPFLLRRFNIPAVISLLLVGILIGPTGVGFDLVGVPAEQFQRHASGEWMPGMKALSGQCAAGPCQRSHMPLSKYAGGLVRVRSFGVPHSPPFHAGRPTVHRLHSPM